MPPVDPGEYGKGFAFQGALGGGGPVPNQRVFATEAVHPLGGDSRRYTTR